MESYHHKFLHGKAKIIKCVRSHYWELKGLSPMQCYWKYLKEAHVLCVTSRKLLSRLRELPIPAFLVSSGVDTDTFIPHNDRKGPIVVGWAGNASQPIKQLDMLKQACEGICTLKIVSGDVSHESMIDFYNSIDVIVTSSKAEGDPRPILEGMSCGNFPIAFPVGITTEVIAYEVNGLLVPQNDFSELRKSLKWCKDNPEIVRKTARYNHELIRVKRDWKTTVPNYANVYEYLLSR
jgi:hypothetical protein